jgi:hypothetical protein
MTAYSEPYVYMKCGPTQESDLSISISISGFSPNTLIYYKYIRSDNSLVYGGFSAGTFGRNTISINVGPHTGLYTIYIYKDANSYNAARPTYSSTITLPCATNHFTAEYYKSHPEIIQYLEGIRSIYNKIRIGNYIVTSSNNALKIFNSSNSNFVIDQLAAQLLAAKLNVINGEASNCIYKTISSANAFMTNQHYDSQINFLRTTIDRNLQGIVLFFKDKLEEYNSVGCSR